MNEFIQFTGWLLILLTFIGSFRLAQYLGRSTTRLYPLLIASTLTSIFIIIVDMVILITGILTITLPAVLVLQRITGISLPLPTPSIRQHNNDTTPEPVPAPAHDREPDGLPVMDLIGRLTQFTDRLRQTREPAQLDIIDLEDNDYWEDHDDD